MDIKQIKELMTFMEKVKIKKLHIKKEKGFELTLEKETPDDGPIRHHFSAPHKDPHHHHFPHHAPPPSRYSSAEDSIPAADMEPLVKEGTYVTSPMVGTFYASPSPEDPHFVKEGDQVDEETVVCIIEAMKVMNEVKSGVKGKVAEILVENGHPVEFGTKIFRIV